MKAEKVQKVEKAYSEKMKSYDYKRKKQFLRHERSHAFGFVLSLVFIFLMIAYIFNVSKGDFTIPTFSSLLEALSQAPQVSIPFTTDLLSSSLQDWGFWNFLRDFFSTILTIIDVLIFAINGLLSIIMYVIYFFRWLFI